MAIPLSHYCEKARWALERAGIEYEQDGHFQGLHRIHAKLAGGGIKVPVLVTGEGVLDDSTDILRWVDTKLAENQRLVPESARAEVEALEEEFDEGLGIEGRRWMYAVTLGTDIPRRYGLDQVPAWERRIVPLLLPVVGSYIARLLDAEPDKADEAMAEVERAFDRVDALLSDGRRYLVADRFTAADLTFAALSSAVLGPDRYGIPLPSPDEFPPEAAASIRRLRDRPAGQFAARIVAEHRPWPPGGSR